MEGNHTSFCRVLPQGQNYRNNIVLQGSFEITYLIHGPHFTDEETDVQKDCQLPKDTKLGLENSFLTPNTVLFLYWQASLIWDMFLSLQAKLDLSETFKEFKSTPKKWEA